jgi:hypothetical protein
MDPNVWGGHAWVFLHSITYNYPDNPSVNDINNHYNFFKLLKDVLPCNTCRFHYEQNLEKFPLSSDILSSRQNLIKWLFKIHNSINKMNNKPEITLEEMNRIYGNLYNNNINKKTNNLKSCTMDKLFIYTLAIAIIVLSIIFIKKIYKK